MRSTPQSRTLGKYLQVRPTSYCWALGLSKIFTGPLFQVKLHLRIYEVDLIQWISQLRGDFEIHWVRPSLVNFRGLAGKRNYWQDRANSHRSRASQIVLIFNTYIGLLQGMILRECATAITMRSLCYPWRFLSDIWVLPIHDAYERNLEDVWLIP